MRLLIGDALKTVINIGFVLLNFFKLYKLNLLNESFDILCMFESVSIDLARNLSYKMIDRKRELLFISKLTPELFIQKNSFLSIFLHAD